MGAAPLNLTSKSFNAAMPTLVPLRDFERESGPFSVHRYLFPKTGIPTFGGADVAFWPADLVPGHVDGATRRVPSNSGSRRARPRTGPLATDPKGLPKTHRAGWQALPPPPLAVFPAGWGRPVCPESKYQRFPGETGPPCFPWWGVVTGVSRGRRGGGGFCLPRPRRTGRVFAAQWLPLSRSEAEEVSRWPGFAGFQKRP